MSNTYSENRIDLNYKRGPSSAFWVASMEIDEARFQAPAGNVSQTGDSAKAEFFDNLPDRQSVSNGDWNDA
jgi:hypothetical protein